MHIGKVLESLRTPLNSSRFFDPESDRQINCQHLSNMTGITDRPITTMDEPALRKLNRAQIQQLARQENIKANIKTEAILSQLLRKYPGGVPKKTTSSSGSKRNKRRSTVKTVNVRVSVKEEEDVVSDTTSHMPTVSSLPSLQNDSQFSQIEHPSEGPELVASATVSATSHALLPTVHIPKSSSPLPRPANLGFLATRDSLSRVPPQQSHSVNTSTLPVHMPQPMHHSPPSSRPLSPPYPTYHETHEMLRTLTHLINATSFDPQSTTSIEYKINALDQLLDDKVIPRLMKVDKDVKDMVWTRIALETECISKFKEEGVLPDGYMNKKVYNLEPSTNKQHAVNPTQPPLGSKRKRAVDEDPSVSHESSRNRSPSLGLEYVDGNDVPPVQKRSRVSAQ